MLKKVLTLILVYSILLQGGTRVGIMAYYELNKAYISNVFCINKNKPALGCKGKCYLTKKLKAQEETEKKCPVNVKATSDFNLFCNYNSIEIGQLNILENKKPNYFYLLGFYPKALTNIFHPPQLSC